jgi:transposase-like protein
MAWRAYTKVAPVQPRRDKAAALKLMRKLLKKQGYVPRVLVTDKLRS